jgi:hypothetical protein
MPRVPTVEVCAFVRRGEPGDYGWQLTEPRYNETLHVYNENLAQQRDKSDNRAGGGNACARPHRPTGLAIGMPTGERGGYSSLSELIRDNPSKPGETARDTIDEAADEIVEHILGNGGRFKQIVYSVNESEADERKDLLGAGIFLHSMGRDVRVYATDKLLAIPGRVAQQHHANRRAQRAGGGGR